MGPDGRLLAARPCLKHSSQPAALGTLAWAHHPHPTPPTHRPRLCTLLLLPQGKHMDRLLTVAYLPANLAALAVLLRHGSRLTPRMRVVGGFTGYTAIMLAVPLQVRLCGCCCVRLGVGDSGLGQHRLRACMCLPTPPTACPACPLCLPQAVPHASPPANPSPRLRTCTLCPTSPVSLPACRAGQAADP